NRLPESQHPASDWEILFGLLEVGEILEIAPGLFKEGFRTCFMRASVDPKPIGIDLLEEQQGYLNEVVDLVFTLTPRDGRGIPLWLDIIDKNVRITDAVMKGLLSTYLGEDYVEFLIPKREKREI
ncbi:MAG: DNA double-strand break repair nuclease NurA, partial [Tepidanaerobacteraceae bacterium]|nr:DNA double-strand break repair nuclease NurA [Tepidanaerobacteraceae bacterium]